MGLDIYLRWNGVTAEEKQAQYRATPGEGGPVGYLRSSYNGGGFNTWCRNNMQVSGFYHIFGYDGEKEVAVDDGSGDEDQEGFYPDWDQAARRTHELIERVPSLPKLLLMSVGSPVTPPGMEHPDSKDILPAYAEEAARWQERHGSPQDEDDEWTAYSSWQGTFFPRKPVTVRAVMWGDANGIRGRASAYLVIEDETAHDWYLAALYDTLRFIEFGREKNGWLVWSS